MKFKKEWLQEAIAWGDIGKSYPADEFGPDSEVVSREKVGEGRWHNRFEAIFKSGGKNYLLKFDGGKTEMQERDALGDYAPDEIECPEVEVFEEVETITRIRHRPVTANG